MDVGSGGLGAISLGIGGWVVILLVVLLVLFGVWQIAKLIWAALSS